MLIMLSYNELVCTTIKFDLLARGVIYVLLLYLCSFMYAFLYDLINFRT